MTPRLAGLREPRQAREPRANHAVANPAQAEPARALLDVNVLIALLDADRLRQRRARAGLAENIASGWASCAITQNGCVRISSQPCDPNPLPTPRVAVRLRAAKQTAHRRFVPGTLSLLDGEHVDAEQLLGLRHTTDAYRLGLAVAHRLRLVTFDADMPLRVVRGAKPGHVVAL